jgi:hypothetical protein
VSWLGLAGLLWDPSAPAAAPKISALFIVALLWGGSPRRLPPAAACFLAFTAWMTWRSPDFLGWWAASALVLAALGAGELRELIPRVSATVGGGASLLALCGIPTQGNPDWLGLVIAAALPFSRRWWLILLELAGLAVSRSRTAWLAALVALVVLSRRRWLAAAALGIAAAAVVVGLAWGALAGRVWIWQHSALVAFRHPLLGAGEFSSAFAAVQGETLRRLPLAEACRRFVYTPSAHDDYLQVAAEAGLPGLLLLVASLVLCAHAHRRWPSALACLAAVAVAAVGDRPLAQPPILMLLALLIAACPSPEGGTRWKPLLCAAGLALALPSWWAARLVTRAHDEDPPTRAATLMLAERLDPRSGPIAFEVGLAALERHDLDLAIGRFQTARRRFFQPATEVALGNALLEHGGAARAVEVYTHLLQLQPGSLRARLNLSEALRREGLPDDADREWSTARALWPGHVRERD